LEECGSEFALWLLECIKNDVPSNPPDQVNDLVERKFSVTQLNAADDFLAWRPMKQCIANIEEIINELLRNARRLEQCRNSLLFKRAMLRQLTACGAT
jgi:hypothetical protein